MRPPEPACICCTAQQEAIPQTINHTTSLMTSAELLLPCAISLCLFLGKTNPCAPALREGLPQVWVGAARLLPAPQRPAVQRVRSRSPTPPQGSGALGPSPGDAGGCQRWGQPVLALCGVCAQHGRAAPWPGPSRATTTQRIRDNIKNNSYGTIWHKTPPSLHNYVFIITVARGRTLL